MRVSDEETRSMVIQANEVFGSDLQPNNLEQLSEEIEKQVLKPLLQRREEPRSRLLVSEQQPAPQQPRYQPPQQGIGPVIPPNNPFVGIGSSGLFLELDY